MIWFVLGMAVSGGLLYAHARNHSGPFIAEAHVINGQVIRYTIALNHWLPKLTPWHEFAVTLGSTTYVDGPRCWPALHAHELKHVEQWRRYRWRMAFYYLRGLVTRGYVADWAEAEAIAFQQAHDAEFADVNPFGVTP